MNDKEIIKQIQRGRKELLDDLIQRYYDDILHFCTYQIHNITDAYDLTQETFYRFIRKVDTFECTHLKAYLIKIARNLCIDYWKAKIETVEICEAEDQVKDCMTDKNTAFETVENGLILTDLLSELSVEQREIIVMRYYCDLKISDIAKILDVNISTVKSRLRIGVINLKKIAGRRTES